jgi:glycosyltransferase involved in cell wall biosynthesis
VISRLVVVSHACVLAENQSVYADLEENFDVTLVVPKTWRDELRHEPYRAQRLERFRGSIREVHTLGRGRVQRHVAIVNARRLLKSSQADFLIVEEEPFSLAGIRWARAARRLGIGYAVQVAENLDRSLPGPIERARTTTLSHARFVLARSPAALHRAQQWGFSGDAAVLGHGVETTDEQREFRATGVVGFVGRLVEAKGVTDIVAALLLEPQLRLRVAGEGPLRDRFDVLGDRVEMLGTLAPEAMEDFYRSVDVVAVPSRTTPHWSEQFGRVLVEAQASFTPVVAYDSGEIAWVAQQTAVTLIREGDIPALAAALQQIGTDSVLAAQIGERGHALIKTTFSNRALAEQLSEILSPALTNRSERGGSAPSGRSD